VGAQEGEGAIAGRSPCCSRPMPGPYRSINIAGCGAPETSQNGWRLRGSATGDVQWPIGPRTTGRGIAVPPLLPARWTPLDNRSTLRKDGQARRRAAAGSPSQWRTCQKADVQRNGGTRSSTGPGMPSAGDHRPTVGRSLVSILGSREIPFPGSRKKIETLELSFQDADSLSQAVRLYPRKTVAIVQPVNG